MSKVDASEPDIDMIYILAAMIGVGSPGFFIRPGALERVICLLLSLFVTVDFCFLWPPAS